MPLTVSHKAREVELSHLHKGLHYAAVFGNEDKDAPMHCGLFTIKGSEATTFLYPAAEFVIVLKGELVLEDTAKPGAVTVKAGDVVRVDKGTTVKWSSLTEGEGFYVSQLPHDEDLKKHIV